ncbi:hypothetical protein niasHT_014226 [Heterodera trifolii]|uniref:BED-type domain-containing protein n=1 Tax=Heterodera trifolii TaxID=157864 RepID=A0ABD2KXI3_9BILA
MDSVWQYFDHLPNNYAKCKNCDWNQQQDKTKSTKNMIRHLEKFHKELELERKRAKDKKLEAMEKALATIPKITQFASSDPTKCTQKDEDIDGSSSSQPSLKRGRICSGEKQQTIVENFCE